MSEHDTPDAEARYRALFDYCPDGILIGDSQSYYLDANPAMCQMLGYTRSELIGLHATDIIDADVRLISDTIDMVNAGDNHMRLWWFRRKDGSIFPADVRSTKMPDGNLIGVIRDVTERFTAEAALRESEERFRQLAENINEVFWITDPGKQQVLYISPAFEHIWGRSRAELHASPSTWLEAVHPQDRERVAHAALHKQVRGTYDEVYRIVRPDGSVRWIHDRAFPVANANGAPYRIVGTAEDITARRLAEERVAEQAALLDQTQDAIVVSNFAHEVLYWNRGAERIYGWTDAEALGRSVRDLLYKEPAELDRAVADVMAHGRWTGEARHVTRNGADLTVEGRWTLLRDERSEPRSVLAVNTDVTDRRRLEEQFLRAQRMESVGTLAGGMAHDLNNILSPILLSLEMLKTLPVAAQDQQLLETLEANTRRGAQLVRQVLSFARGVEVTRQLVDPIDLLDELLKVVRETFPRNITVVMAAPTSVGLVAGDPTQLHQVFMNLLVNARDAMPTGGTLTVRVEQVMVDETYAAMNLYAQPGAYVKLAVIDTGTGIAEDHRVKVFEPFFTTKAVGNGTGLGLSTTQTIVRSHGGFINLYSEVGSGTRFDVYLPAAEGDEASPPTSAAAPLPIGNGELILLVDDEDAIRKVAQRMLEAAGYRVMSAANGAEAVSLYARHKHELALVFTDMAMPIMDGAALIVALRTMNPRVRIVASSGLDAGGYARSIDDNVRQFVSKPYTAETMLNAVHRALL